MVRLNVKQRVLALLDYLLCELLGLQLGHGVRPSCLCVSQVTRFAKAPRVQTEESARCFELH